MRRLLAIVVLVGLVGAARAEIPCQCGQEACQCFIQFGDSGQAVAIIQHLLCMRGYLDPADDSNNFNLQTQNAVIHFQEDNDLTSTGMLDDDTLTLLIWNMSPDELTTLQPWSIFAPVWIPTDGGIRHHCEGDCCAMYDPRLVSQRNAMVMGFLPCGICHPTGLNTDLNYYKER